MKIFQKILIGLCSLLPCFGAVRFSDQAPKQELKLRSSVKNAVTYLQAQSSVFNVKFYPSSSVVSTYGCVQSNVSFEYGVSFAFSPAPDRIPHGAVFSVSDDFVPSCYAVGFLVYSPILDGTNNYVNQYSIAGKGIPLQSKYYPANYTNTFVFSAVGDDDMGPIGSLHTLVCRFTLSTPYSQIDKEKGWFFMLPFVITKPVSSELVSAFSVGLWNGFLGGLSYSKPQQEFQYQAGFTDGQSTGLKKGYSQGYEAGKALADKDVYKKGYDKGYTDGSNTLTPATTIWGLFGAIASVPTEILNGMGGIAIWNTPILAILFSLLFLAMVLWIIRKFI